MGVLSNTGGIDYTGPSPSMITFGPGQSVGDEHCTVVSVVDDNLIEDEETFNLILSVSPADVDLVDFIGRGTSSFNIIQDPNDSKAHTHYTSMEMYALLSLAL